MKFWQDKRGIIIEIKDFVLEQTLDCGQCFRFSQRPDGSWHGVAGSRPITLRALDNNRILFEKVSIQEFNSFWRIYFDLDRDYAKIRSQFPCHPAFKDSVCFGHGIRILRQEPWEALVSFIISQNYNVPRIKGIIERLCRHFGKPVGEDYGFPSPAALSVLDVSDLEVIRCGFRAKYIIDAAQKVSCGQVDLQEISKLPLSKARQALQTIKGVGPKVAECVLLYGMGRLETFPMDVWIKRAMARLFPGYTPDSFGQYAGIAQQYIYHYCRCNPWVLREETG